MGSYLKFVIGTAIFAIALYFVLNFKLFSAPILNFRYDEVWGKSDSKSTEVKPFKIKVSDEVLNDLKSRLDKWRPPAPTMDGVGYFYGIPSQKVKDLVDYWRGQYSWRKAEEKINSMSQFQTVIKGLNVHFVHIKGDPSAKLRIPLLLVHGWPGSFLEFYKVIPLFTANKNGVSFDVVVPSIPGYTFSEAPAKVGFGPIAAADIFQLLMSRLGYQKFVYQGGDWGLAIGHAMAYAFPDRLIGFHTNWPVPPVGTVMDVLHFGSAFLFPNLVVGEKEAWKVVPKIFQELAEESGYFHEQATKPDTVGIALSDSPVGLVAYIFEKFSAWAENVEFKSGWGLSNEDMLTNVMLYWVTNHITSSLRLYKESVIEMIPVLSAPINYVPVASACYPNEIACTPKNVFKRNKARLVQYSEMPRGGHFAAFEEPELFTEDVRRAVDLFVKIRQDEDKWGSGLGLGI